MARKDYTLGVPKVPQFKCCASSASFNRLLKKASQRSLEHDSLI